MTNDIQASSDEFNPPVAFRHQRIGTRGDRDFLIDGGTTASYFYGDLQYLKATH